MTEFAPPPLYNGPDIPIAYDSQWQFFVNLTPAQIAWFQAQPEWATYVAAQPVTDWAARAASIQAATAAKATKGPPSAKLLR